MSLCVRLPDGLTRRGDINVLLLGDPGTAKSQLLKFVENCSPIGVRYAPLLYIELYVCHIIMVIIIIFLSVQCNTSHGIKCNITCGVCVCVSACLYVRTGFGGRISRKLLKIEALFQRDTNRKLHMAN